MVPVQDVFTEAGFLASHYCPLKVTTLSALRDANAFSLLLWHIGRHWAVCSYVVRSLAPTSTPQCLDMARS
jgi:hypothetical protein